jgi:hypothetical protein
MAEDRVGTGGSKDRTRLSYSMSALGQWRTWAATSWLVRLVHKRTFTKGPRTCIKIGLLA